MTGRKTLKDVRAELEAAMPTGPTGVGTIAESLRRFLYAGEKPSLAKPEIAPALNEATLPPDADPALEHGR